MAYEKKETYDIFDGHLSFTKYAANNCVSS